MKLRRRLLNIGFKDSVVKTLIKSLKEEHGRAFVLIEEASFLQDLVIDLLKTYAPQSEHFVTVCFYTDKSRSKWLKQYSDAFSDKISKEFILNLVEKRDSNG